MVFIIAICMLALTACTNWPSHDDGSVSLVDAENPQASDAASFLRALADDGSLPKSSSEFPAYDGSASFAVNGDVPFFDAEGAIPLGSERYSTLDMLGRCRVACAVVGVETMPAVQRGSIGDIRPSGWRISKYDWIDGKYLFNRCHLIGYQLTGQNANDRNLITGTRYMNVEGMQPFENGIADYVRSTQNHVLLRVTPFFEGRELVARGVLMEAFSIEDNGSGIMFCRWCPNVEPGVQIDYKTGENWADGTQEAFVHAQEGESEDQQSSSGANASEGNEDSYANPAPETTEVQGTADYDPNEEYDYILNKNSHLIHRPDCPAVAKMSVKNKLGFNGTREEALALEDYEPCSYCNP